MFVKFVRVRISPEQFRKASGLIREELVPRDLAHDGTRQVCWMADPAGGNLLGITCGDGARPSPHQEADVGRVRTALLEHLGAALLGTETFAVPDADRCAPMVPADHPYVRIAQLEGVPARAPRSEELRTALSRSGDDRSVVRWFRDDSTGNAIVLLAWADRDGWSADRISERRLRHRARRSLGCRITSTRDYETFTSALGTPTAEHVEQLPALGLVPGR